MRTFPRRAVYRPPGGLSRHVGRLGLAAGVALAVTAQTVASLPPATLVADALPRAYAVDSIAEVPAVQINLQHGLTADGGTAIHLAPHRDNPRVLVVTTLSTGAAGRAGHRGAHHRVGRAAADPVEHSRRTRVGPRGHRGRGPA